MGDLGDITASDDIDCFFVCVSLHSILWINFISIFCSKEMEIKMEIENRNKKCKCYLPCSLKVRVGVYAWVWMLKLTRLQTSHAALCRYTD